MRPRLVVVALFLLVVAGIAQAAAQARVVSGEVRDAATAAPVAGAEVSVRGTAISTRTAPDGTFTLGVPAGSVELVVRRIGYQRALVTVPAASSTVTVS